VVKVGSVSRRRIQSGRDLEVAHGPFVMPHQSPPSSLCSRRFPEERNAPAYVADRPARSSISNVAATSITRLPLFVKLCASSTHLQPFSQHSLSPGTSHEQQW
jgi:hypothetical protein